MKILFINACVREESRTFILATELLAGMNGNIETLNLGDLDLKPLNEQRIKTRLNDPNEQVYAKQFADADVIVIAAPMWDLSFPALLKLYIENVNITNSILNIDSEDNTGGSVAYFYYVYVWLFE